MEDRMSEEKAKQESKNKTDVEILFPEIEVDGYKIKPWTLGKLIKINPHLERIFTKLEEKGIKLSIDTIDTYLRDIYFAAVPEIVSILAISLEKSIEDLEDLAIPTAIKLIYAIYKQNEESVKNVLVLLQAAQI
jgi:hypothetical protein